MNRWVVFFSVFLLVFTSSGAHKIFALSGVAQAATEIQLEMPDNVTKQGSCCEKNLGQTTMNHGSCSVPCIEVENPVIVFDSTRSISLDSAFVGIPKGINSALPKRPPKFLLI